jgi:GT2 family glycosyltransferase
VWVVIPVWNGCQDTVECLTSLAGLRWPRLEVLVVDNGSVDGTAEVLASRFPAVTVLRLPRNTGYTGGCNVGMRHAFAHGADAVLLLNNDTVIEPEAVQRLVAAGAAWPRPALLSPLILYHGAPDVVWYGGGRVDLASGVTVHEHSESRHYPTETYRTQWANGCACLLSRRAYETLGGLDPAYFASYEDVDLSLRARRAGLDVVVVPGAKVWHKVSASWRGQGQFYFYTVRNRLYLLRKFSGRRTALAWSARLGAGAAAYALVAALRGRRAEAKTYLFTLSGVLAFLAGRRGQAPTWVYRWGKI